MENPKDELQFYSKFTRPLIFNLPDAKDRVLAAGWVKKIREDESGNDRLKTDYIKLLLFALQRKKLVGIFADDPEHYEKLEDFPPDFDLNSMAKTLIQKEQSERVERIRKQLRGQIGDYPPYTTDCSSDFREYAAAQDIPGFGVHCYYAFSKEPINFWQRADRGIYPKITKSAVDASSPLPPGVSERTSDPSCVCPPAPGEQDSSCKARAHKSKDPTKKRRPRKKLGKKPPTEPIGKTPLPEERVPPTWSSNLMEVREHQLGEESDLKPVKSTGAVPKIRTDKQKRRALKKGRKPDDSDAEEEELREMENALKDYRSGEIRSRRRRGRPRRGRPSDDEDEEEEEEDLPEDEIPEEVPEEDEEDSFLDLDTSKFQEELDEDSALLEQFKDRLSQARQRQRVADRKKQIGGVSPAEAGIPVTTPKAAPSPRRQESSEKLYAQEEPAQAQAEATEVPKSPTKRQPSALKDLRVHKLFEEASAMPEELEGDRMVQALEDFHEDDMFQMPLPPPPPEPDKEPPPAFEGKPMTPIERGSAQANAVFSDVLGTLQDAGTSTPPIFSRDPKIREEAQKHEYSDHLYEDVDEWVSGPQYFADKNDFQPYDPREEHRQVQQLFGEPPRTCGNLLFDQDSSFEFEKSLDVSGDDDMYGLPKVVEVSKMPRPPAPKPFRYSKPEKPSYIFDIPEGDTAVGEAAPKTPPCGGTPPWSYATPEHLKSPKRDAQPQPCAAYRRAPSPGEFVRPPAKDEFFFDFQDAPPMDISFPESPPGASPGVNMLGVQEMGAGASGIVCGLPPENVFGVQPLDTRDKYIDFVFEEDNRMKDLMKSIASMPPADDLFSETMPQVDDIPPVYSPRSDASSPGEAGGLFPELDMYLKAGTGRVNLAGDIEASRARVRARQEEEARAKQAARVQKTLPQKPTRRGSLGPMYFPPQAQKTWYPPVSPGLSKKLKKMDYDEEFFDPNRGGSQSRFLIVGKTSTKMKDIGRKFAPEEGNIISEVEEPPMSPPRTPRIPCGLPPTPQRQSPLRTPPAPSPRAPTPQQRIATPPPPRAPSPEDPDPFARPYIPPIYQSPCAGAGIMDESPPLAPDDDANIRRELVLDERREPLAPSLREANRRRQLSNKAAIEEAQRLINEPWKTPTFETPPRRAPARPAAPRPVTPEAQPAPPIAGTPRAEKQRGQPCGAQRGRRSRITEGSRGRRLDFDAPEPGVPTEVDKYIADLSRRTYLPPLPPREPSPPPPQPSLLDTWVPGNIPSPIRPPTVVPGWQTPPHLARQPCPQYQVNLPPVDPDQYFFDMPEEAEFAPSPEQLSGYEYATPQQPAHSSFFGDAGQSFFAPGELSQSVCGSPTCQSGQSRLASSPVVSPRSPVTTPLKDYGGDFFTPPSGAGARTPITRADRIFQEAGIVESPIQMVDIPPTPPPPRTPYSPLSDPAEMQRMRERVQQAEGKRGIKQIRQAEEQDRPVEQLATTCGAGTSKMRQELQKRKEKEERRQYMEERHMRNILGRPPSMPRIQEYVSPVPYRDPHGLPLPKKVDKPRSWADTYVSPYRHPPSPPVCGDEMKRVMSDIEHGRLAHLDVIQMEESVTPQLSPPPQIPFEYSTPERLKPQPMSPPKKLIPQFALGTVARTPVPQQQTLMRSPSPDLWEGAAAQSFGQDLGVERMEFPPSPGQISPGRSPPCGPPATMTAVSPRQLFQEEPPQQGTPRRTPPQGTAPCRAASPQGAGPAEDTPGRVVTHRVSQRRIVTTMLPTPPGSPREWNLSDSFIPDDEADFKWMD